MSRHRHSLVALLVLVSLAAPASAAEKGCDRKQTAATAGSKPPPSMPEMTGETHMRSEMAKPGAMAMDVSEAASAKDDCMRPMLDKEQGMMDVAKPGRR